MSELTHSDLLRLTRKLQGLNLSGYEARSYLTLIRRGPSRGPDLALQAGVPRQKIYDVLDSLAAKGFAEIISDKPRVYTAVEPGGALASYLVRKRQERDAWLADQRRLIEELRAEMERLPPGAHHAPEALPRVRVLGDPEEAAARLRQLLEEVRIEWLDCLAEPGRSASEHVGAVLAAARRGADCRLLVEPGWEFHRRELAALVSDEARIEVRSTRRLPMHFALSDGRTGLVGFEDGALWFEHPRLGSAFKALFEDYWRRAAGVAPDALALSAAEPLERAAPEAARESVK